LRPHTEIMTPGFRIIWKAKYIAHPAPGKVRDGQSEKRARLTDR